MSGAFEAITAEKVQFLCIGLVLASTLGFCANYEKENLNHNLNCFSEQKLIYFFSLMKLFLVNT